MGFSSKKQKAPEIITPPPPVTETAQEVVQTENAVRRKAQTENGLRSTMLAMNNETSLRKKSLLGQGG